MCGAMKPSESLHELLTGRVAWDDAHDAIRSWARKPIYDAAKVILTEPGRGERRNKLGRIPAAIRPHVEAEVKRLWAMK